MSYEEIRIPVGLTVNGLIARRYLARFIDWVAMLLLIGIEFTLLGGIAQNSAARGLLVLGVFLVTFMSYGGVLESSSWQATFGKKILGMRVYGKNGGRISLRQGLTRNLVKDGPFLVFAILPFGQLLGFVLLGAHLVVVHRSPVYQAIHDRIVGTLVAAPEQTTSLHISV